MRVKRSGGGKRGKASFDLIVQVVEVSDDYDDEDAQDRYDFEQDVIDVQAHGEDDRTFRRELLAPEELDDEPAAPVVAAVAPVAELPAEPASNPAMALTTESQSHESHSQDPEIETDGDHGFFATSGAQLSKYQLGRRLGEGSFGVVFAARDTVLDREVAIKLLTSQHAYDPQILLRFLQEATAAARIKHPGIVTMFDCGHLDGTAFIAMELLEGETLTSRLARSGRLPPEVAIEIVRQVASALAAAHHAGVIHRDLKPDNIFLTPDPAVASGERVKILDFGLAKLRHQISNQTQARIVFGTPRYMSPEQTRSAAKADHRSDIYALGCVLFELVCGRPPFDGEMLDVVGMHQRATPPRARAFVPSLHGKLDKLISDMLAKNPDQRPQTMAAVQRSLQELGAVAPGAAETMLPQVLVGISGDMFDAETEAGDEPVREARPPVRTRAVGTAAPLPASAKPITRAPTPSPAPAPAPVAEKLQPLPPIIARSSRPIPSPSARSQRIEHTLPWGRVDLDPEVVVTSALAPTPLTKIRAATREEATVLHAPADSTPLPALSSPFALDDSEAEAIIETGDQRELAHRPSGVTRWRPSTLDLAPPRKRYGVALVAALVALVVAAGVLSTLYFVQGHHATAVTASPIHVSPIP